MAPVGVWMAAGGPAASFGAGGSTVFGSRVCQSRIAATAATTTAAASDAIHSVDRRAGEGAGDATAGADRARVTIVGTGIGGAGATGSEIRGTIGTVAAPGSRTLRSSSNSAAV